MKLTINPKARRATFYMGTVGALMLARYAFAQATGTPPAAPAAAAATPPPALNSGDTAWMLVSTALLIFSKVVAKCLRVQQKVYTRFSAL